jgi:transcriptional regulator NrdR family protein
MKTKQVNKPCDHLSGITGNTVQRGLQCSACNKKLTTKELEYTKRIWEIERKISQV